MSEAPPSATEIVGIAGSRTSETSRPSAVIASVAALEVVERWRAPYHDLERLAGLDWDLRFEPTACSADPGAGAGVLPPGTGCTVGHYNEVPYSWRHLELLLSAGEVEGSVVVLLTMLSGGRHCTATTTPKA
jgi:hypothetical protein